VRLNPTRRFASPRIAGNAYRSSDYEGDALPSIRYDEPNAAAIVCLANPKIVSNVVPAAGLTTS
jgi:hypothetical protein